MRIGLGMFVQETLSLAPRPASLQSFRDSLLAEGPAITAAFRGTATEIGAITAAAGKDGVELVPTIAARAGSSAPVTRDAFEYISERLLTLLRAAGNLDAVLLVLHGAALVDGIDDGTGELLRRVREVIGPRCPLVGTLDLHANVTDQMVASADALVGYHTYPHVDTPRTGQRGLWLATTTAAGQIHPVMALRRLPMIVPPTNGSTSEGPMAELMTHVEAVEGEPGVLSASAFAVQPWLNVPDLACTTLVVADGDRAAADRHAGVLADHFWRLREAFYDYETVPVAEAIRRCREATSRPIVLADEADGSGSGASGDSTWILQGLLDARATEMPAYISIVDPGAVAECTRAGVGSTLTLDVGGTIDRFHYRPCRVTGYVRMISDGVFTYKGPQGTGDKGRRGLTVVFSVGEVQLVLTEITAFNWDPEFYRSLGLEPRDARAVVVKSPLAFRAAYAGLMADAMLVDAPGPATSNLRSLAGRLDRVRRPFYPFDSL